MTGYDVKMAKLHAASLRRFVYDIVAELIQAVELVDGYLFLFGQQPKYKDKTEPEENDD